MDITVEYTRDEVNRIVLEAHEKVFGKPPNNEGQWKVTNSGYGALTVENSPKPKPERAVKSEPSDEVVPLPPAEPLF